MNKAWSGSAVGHLVSLLGVTDSDAGFKSSGGYADQPSRIQVMVNMFGLAERQIENKAAL